MAPKGNDSKKATAKKAEKIVEDKTFGLKNKNKSKKVQQYVAQVSAQVKGAKNEAHLAAMAAQKKKEKEERERIEREMLLTLGKDYAGDLNKKMKKKTEQKKQEEHAEAERKRKEAHERDFAVPITTLEQISRIDSKASVVRCCVVLDHKDNLASKTFKGEECMFVRGADGTTRTPFTITCIGWNPSNFEFKVDSVIDIRNCTAIIRGEKVELEVVKGVGTITGASPELSEHIIKLKEEADELRAQGGLPVEEIIEEARQKLREEGKAVTPVTKENFFEWKERKRIRKEKEAEEKRLAAQKKMGGKGIQVLSGKQLFAYDPTLFADDAEAVEGAEYEVVADAVRDSDDDDDDEGDDDNNNDDDNDEDNEGNDGAGAGVEDDDDDDDQVKKVSLDVNTKLYLETADDDLDDLDDD